MERPLKNAQTPSPPEPPVRKAVPHLMCGTPFWGIAAAAACTYFAYSAYSQLREGEFYWQHGSLTVVTWAVWVLLITGLFSETRCWRERIFFGLLWANFVSGFVLAAWSTASADMVRNGSRISLVLWILSAVAALSTVRRPAPAPPANKA